MECRWGDSFGTLAHLVIIGRSLSCFDFMVLPWATDLFACDYKTRGMAAYE